MVRRETLRQLSHGKWPDVKHRPLPKQGGFISSNLSALPDYFNTDPKCLKREILLKQGELDRMRQALAAKQRNCQHVWDAIKYTPDIREGYQDPGDPPGTMGVDRRLPMYVPRQETPKWTRTCKLCDLSEVTTSTRDDVRKVPVF